MYYNSYDEDDQLDLCDVLSQSDIQEMYSFESLEEREEWVCTINPEYAYASGMRRL